MPTWPLDFPGHLRVWDGLTGDLADLHNAVYPSPAFDDETRAVQNNALTSMETAQPAIASHQPCAVGVAR